MIPLVAIVTLAFVVEATAGFGATLVTVTLAAHLWPIGEVLAVFLPVNLVLSAALVVKHHAAVDVPFLRSRVLPWMGAGFLVGLAGFQFQGEGWIKVLFGVFVVGLSLAELWPGPPRAGSAVGRGAALVGAGLVHGLFACGGPMLVWVASREVPDKGRFRVTLSVVWLVLGLILVGSYAVAGTLTASTLYRSACLVPVVFAALWIGDDLHHKVDPVTFRRATFVLLLFAGGSLVLR